MRRPKEKVIAGIDLHGNNLVIGLIDQDGKRLSHQKLDCDLKDVEEFLRPYKQQLQWSRFRSGTTKLGVLMDSFAYK